MSGSFRDATERKRVEEELRKYRDHLEDLVEERTATLTRLHSELASAYQDLEAFSYTVSHDLRSPLAPIIGFAKLLKNRRGSQLDDKAVDMLEEIILQSEKMLSLIGDLLELARVNNTEGPLQLESPERAVCEILKELRTDFPHAEEWVKIRAPLPSVHMHRTHLSQLLSNLIGNALRYAGKNGVPIEVFAKRRGERVRIGVCDHGQGMTAHEKKRAFEAFFRGSAGRKVPGTGIGLTIVAKIAKFYEGRAWVESTPGGGCTISIEVVDRQA